MISVENFYWVLHSTLLQPLEIDAWYYYPWGTQDCLVWLEFQQFDRKYHANHVLFYDQEPIWNMNLGKEYEQVNSVEWSIIKFVKLLANSEWSDTKKQICKDRNMLDWYYFYHGFASLDWYRDGANVWDDVIPIKVFSSLSHHFRNQRSYRLALSARLVAAGIRELGDMSLHANRVEIEQEIRDPNTSLNKHDCKLIETYLLDQVPIVADQCHVDSDFSAHFGRYELKFWQRSFWHIVNETVFYPQKLHLTEKTFKPIVALRPFILVAAPGNLEYLRSYGFRTFGTWIDESYDLESDPAARLDKIVKEITRLCSMSWTELRQMHRDMMSTLEYNKRHLFGEFRRIIVNELVDNFDQCIRIWNNGRVDGRELPLHPDLDGAKKILLM